ncbi:MAG: hypothetical protein EZS28_043515, partial [Streblomastix strix]
MNSSRGPRVIHIGDETSVIEAIRRARRWAELHKGRGRINIPASEINIKSRGANYWQFVNRQRGQLPEGHQPAIGIRSTVNKAKVEAHPDGHLNEINGPTWHERAHIHATNANGDQIIFTFGPPSQPHGGNVVQFPGTHPEGNVVQFPGTHPEGNVVQFPGTHPQGNVVQFPGTHPQGNVVQFPVANHENIEFPGRLPIEINPRQGNVVQFPGTHPQGNVVQFPGAHHENIEFPGRLPIEINPRQGNVVQFPGDHPEGNIVQFPTVNPETGGIGGFFRKAYQKYKGALKFIERAAVTIFTINSICTSYKNVKNAEDENKFNTLMKEVAKFAVGNYGWKA